MTANSPSDANPLWDFAVALYSNPAVEETALQLQNEHGINVNLLLWACWLDVMNQPVHPARFTEAETLIAPLQNHWVEPIRQLRRAASEPHLKPLKSALLAAELEAEKQVLAVLYQYSTDNDLDKPVRPTTKKLQNVNAYLLQSAPIINGAAIIATLSAASVSFQA